MSRLPAIRSINGTFTGTGTSEVATLSGFYNAWLGGTWVGTVELQRQLLGQSSFHVVNTYTAPPDIPVEGHEPDGDGGEYRWECTAFTSGTIEFRLSQ